VRGAPRARKDKRRGVQILPRRPVGDRNAEKRLRRKGTLPLDVFGFYLLQALRKGQLSEKHSPKIIEEKEGGRVRASTTADWVSKTHGIFQHSRDCNSRQRSTTKKE